MAVLTISREFGSGGRTVGRTVAGELQYEYVDRGIILDEMRKAGKQWEETASYYDENYPDITERYRWTYRGFVALNQLHILEYALKDNVVIMGRGGNFLLRGIPYALRVRIKAPIEDRVKRVMQREGVNSENALWLLEKADSEMARAVYLIYGKQIDDLSQYDMALDVGIQTVEQISATLREALLLRDRHKTPEAQAVLHLRVVAARIKAAIATDPSFSVSVIDVDPKEEGLPEYGLIVRAVIHDQADGKRIEELARTIAGNVPLDFQLPYRWIGRTGRQEFK